MRDVTENARTLKPSDYGFEEQLPPGSGPVDLRPARAEVALVSALAGAAAAIQPARRAAKLDVLRALVAN
ncbi:MAG TPA: hypothetical protein VNZ57_15195 [Longimicrobiales bacterium]|nr:hypothetical protein [Longimicrobiales bacterium]